MTGLVSGSLIALVFIAALLLLEQSRASKSPVVFALTAGLLLRMVVAVILDGGLKYVFVLDSLGYELRGWIRAQPWITADFATNFLATNQKEFNDYEVWLSWIFVSFGKEPLVATICNTIFTTITLALLVFLQREFFIDRNETPGRFETRPEILLVAILTLYPSLMVWSATNNRDPLYFLSCTLFYACFLAAFSARSRFKWPARCASIVGAGIAIWIVLGIRAYVSQLFAASVVVSAILFFGSRRLRWRTLIALTALIAVSFAYAYQLVFPEATAKALANLTDTRISFANLNLMDSVAQSSFGLETRFASITDVLLFMPNALLHYFFGPLPWEVTNLVQAVSLIEAVTVIALVKPTIRGVRRLCERAPFESLTLLCFAITFSISQSLVISNMGTIYRHRTLPFMILLIFACEGLKDVAQKNLSPFFKA